jgi:hypothetical protein
MENEASSLVYSFTKEHESIAPFIHTSAGACPPDELEAVESLSADDSRIRWKKALWDTGATQSCISDRLAAEFGLEADGYVEVVTASGIVEFAIYTVHLVLPSRLVFRNIQVIEFTYGDDDCDLIIGMDIMTQGDLAMTNLEGRTVFSFRIPSLHTVDFEAEHIS